jgi:TatD DNase family protein
MQVSETVMHTEQEYPEVADAHCHLNLFEDPERIIREATERNVAFMVTAGGSNKDNLGALGMSSFDNVFAVVGIDPSFAAKESEHIAELDNMLRISNKVVGIGEIGLDKKVARNAKEYELQKKAFLMQIELAKNMDVPIVVHARNAIADVLDILEKSRVERAMLHFFEGSIEDAKRAERLGFLISIPPLDSKKRERAVKAVGIQSIVAETDAPVAGLRPIDVVKSVGIIAKAKNIAFAEAAFAITENIRKFFYI